MGVLGSTAENMSQNPLLCMEAGMNKTLNKANSCHGMLFC